jgi:3-hydroxyacyl-[acyl-carrier-protein] dehydratase
MKPLFAFADRVEFDGIGSPGERVTVRGHKEYFRRGNLKSSISIENEAGKVVCSGLLYRCGGPDRCRQIV